MGGLLAVLLEDQLEPGVGHNDDDNVDDDDDDHHLLLVRLSELGIGLADLLSYFSLSWVRRKLWIIGENFHTRGFLRTTLTFSWNDNVSEHNEV